MRALIVCALTFASFSIVAPALAFTPGQAVAVIKKNAEVKADDQLVCRLEQGYTLWIIKEKSGTVLVRDITHAGVD